MNRCSRNFQEQSFCLEKKQWSGWHSHGLLCLVSEALGGYVVEALVRSGVGAFDLIDDDKVCLTNLNRQIIATRKTVGKYKAEVMAERIAEINPQADVRIHKCFFLPENAEEFPFDEYDYIVDAVDTVTAKIALVMKAQEMQIPIISSMGAATS